MLSTMLLNQNNTLLFVWHVALKSNMKQTWMIFPYWHSHYENRLHAKALHYWTHFYTCDCMSTTKSVLISSKHKRSERDIWIPMMHPELSECRSLSTNSHAAFKYVSQLAKESSTLSLPGCIIGHVCSKSWHNFKIQRNLHQFQIQGCLHYQGSAWITNMITRNYLHMYGCVSDPMSDDHKRE